jgi:hypothetical protein
MPPVSSATCGLNPGINLDEMAVLQEMDDLESAAVDPPPHAA